MCSLVLHLGSCYHALVDEPENIVFGLGSDRILQHGRDQSGEISVLGSGGGGMFTVNFKKRLA